MSCSRRGLCARRVGRRARRLGRGGRCRPLGRRLLGECRRDCRRRREHAACAQGCEEIQAPH
ncbi:hypothetical protein AKJ09_07458 [Labilithrix luteola]|uniref:Uncharacterized protein n=1 Tax=Labilithrix luteola TaxID=1391654 RepID=A0A0K1Q5X2_9BACT|nr:hypothetical protein AKJ09_07458 [Labilithrix luteola]